VTSNLEHTVDCVRAASLGLQTLADKIMPNGEGFGLVRRTESGHEQVSVEHALEWIMTMESQVRQHPCNSASRCASCSDVYTLGSYRSVVHPRKMSTTHRRMYHRGVCKVVVCLLWVRRVCVPCVRIVYAL